MSVKAHYAILKYEVQKSLYLSVESGSEIICITAEVCLLDKRLYKQLDHSIEHAK